MLRGCFSTPSTMWYTEADTEHARIVSIGVISFRLARVAVSSYAYACAVFRIVQ